MQRLPGYSYWINDKKETRKAPGALRTSNGSAFIVQTERAYVPLLGRVSRLWPHGVYFTIMLNSICVRQNTQTKCYSHAVCVEANGSSLSKSHNAWEPSGGWPVVVMNVQLKTSLFHAASLVILITCATSLAQQQQVFYRGADHRNAKFVKHANTKLDVTPFLREKVEDLIGCVLSCLRHAQCLSFNMAVEAVEDKYDCLLLSTDKYSKSEMLMSTRDFNHHSIPVRHKFHVMSYSYKSREQ